MSVFQRTISTGLMSRGSVGRPDQERVVRVGVVPRRAEDDGVVAVQSTGRVVPDRGFDVDAAAIERRDQQVVVGVEVGVLATGRERDDASVDVLTS